jgi:hypothetical protein
MIANACSSTFTRIKQYIASLVMAPVAIKRLAKNRNVETVIHSPNIDLIFIECQASIIDA